MQNILYAFFIALINNIDNISVRIAYSLKGIKIDIYKNILIAVITFVASTLTALFGNILLNVINPNICHLFTMTIFIILGFFTIFEPYIKHKKNNSLVGIITNPDNADIDNSKNIDLKEAIFLGIALNLDTIGGSFSAGTLGLNIYLVGGLSTIISFLALWLGGYVSNVLKNITKNKRTSLVVGLIFIIIGIKQLF